MRNLKKVLALVLAMAMSLSLAVTAGAAFNDQDKIVNDEAVDMCVALNIINGRTDGSFDPAGNVTRAEMAKMICIVLNGGKAPTTSIKAVPTFADIDGHWAEGFIEYCYAKGVIAGKSATQFDPNGKVTGSEAAKMLLVALGYNAEVEKMVGANWELYTNVLANQDGLYEELESMDPSAALSRDNAAQMIWNALNADVVKVESSIDREDGSIIDNYYKVEGYELLEAKYDAVTDEDVLLTAAEYDTKNAEYKYNDTYKTAADYTDLLGYKVDVVKTEDGKTIYGIYAVDSVEIVSGVIGDIDSAYTYGDTEVEVADVDYDVDADVAGFVFAGGANSISAASARLTAEAFAELNEYDEFVAIDNDDDDKIDVVIVYPITFAQVGYVASDYVRIGGSVYETEANEYVAYEGIAKEDWVAVAADSSLVTYGSITEVEKLTGTVESKSSAGTVKIDGTSYNYIADVAGALVNDEEVEFYVINGYIVKAAPADTAADVSEYAVVTKYAANTDTMAGPQVKLLKTDGTNEVYDVHKDSETVRPGDLVTFEVKSGEYVLTVVDTETEADFDVVGGSLAKAADSALTLTNADKGKSNATIGSAKINADAVVFVYEAGADTEYSVVTGADLAKINDGTTSIKYYGADKNSNNYPFVSFAYVESAQLVTSDVAYGYVVSDVETAGTGDDAVVTFTMWNGTANVPMATEAGYAPTVAKGDIIGYTVNGAGEIDDLDVATANKAATGRVDAVATFDGEDTLTFAGYPDYTYTIDDEDTTVLFIDRTNGVGEADGSIIAADEIDLGGLYTNILFIGNWDGGVLKLLVVDVDNDWADAQA